MTNEEIYKLALHTAFIELQETRKKHADLTLKMARLNRVIEALRKLCESTTPDGGKGGTN